MRARLVRTAHTFYHLLRRGSNPPLPIYAQIEPTNKCNLDCQMCMRQEAFGDGENMGLETFKHIYDQFKPASITLNGWGEPLLNAELGQMIEYAQSRGTTVNVTTNGLLLKRKYAEIIAVGLSKLNVSLDTVNLAYYQEIRRNSTLELVVEGIRLFNEHKSAKQKLQVSAVLVERTLDDMFPFVDQMADLGIATLHFEPLLFYREEYKALLGKYADRTIYRRRLEEIMRYVQTKGIASDIDQVMRNLRFKFDAYENPRQPGFRDCLLPWYGIYVNVKGHVHVCCARGHVRSGSLGNALEEDILTLWNGRGYRMVRENLVRGRPPYPECACCTLSPTLSDLLDLKKYCTQYLKMFFSRTVGTPAVQDERA